MNQPSPEPQAVTCDRCGRASYSLSIWGWCPWCDSEAKPGPQRLVSLRLYGLDGEFLLPEGRL